jgi:hypothetical protein
MMLTRPGRFKKTKASKETGTVAIPPNHHAFLDIPVRAVGEFDPDSLLNKIVPQFP